MAATTAQKMVCGCTPTGSQCRRSHTARTGGSACLPPTRSTHPPKRVRQGARRRSVDSGGDAVHRCSQPGHRAPAEDAGGLERAHGGAAMHRGNVTKPSPLAIPPGRLLVPARGRDGELCGADRRLPVPGHAPDQAWLRPAARLRGPVVRYATAAAVGSLEQGSGSLRAWPLRCCEVPAGAASCARDERPPPVVRQRPGPLFPDAALPACDGSGAWRRTHPARRDTRRADTADAGPRNGTCIEVPTAIFPGTAMACPSQERFFVSIADLDADPAQAGSTMRTVATRRAACRQHFDHGWAWLS